MSYIEQSKGPGQQRPLLKGLYCGFYILYPIFEDHFFVFKEVFQKIMSLCTSFKSQKISKANYLGPNSSKKKNNLQILPFSLFILRSQLRESHFFQNFGTLTQIKKNTTILKETIFCLLKMSGL